MMPSKICQTQTQTFAFLLSVPGRRRILRERDYKGRTLFRDSTDKVTKLESTNYLPLFINREKILLSPSATMPFYAIHQHHLPDSLLSLAINPLQFLLIATLVKLQKMQEQL